MSKTLPQTRGRLRPGFAALTAGAVLLAGAAWGIPAVQAAPQSEAAAIADDAVGSGSLEWGVRNSIRNYLENFSHTEGRIEARNPATYAKGDKQVHFPAMQGTVDVDAGTAQISLGGELNMFGFGESWFNFKNIRFEAAAGVATIRVDMIESFVSKQLQPDFPLATFALPEKALQPNDQNVIELRDLQGFFTPEAVANLPVFGAESPYAAPNNFVDPLNLRVQLGEKREPTPGPSPTVPVPKPTEKPVKPTPDTGPYGLSQGAALSNTTARISVSPGYALSATGETLVSVRGTGFDPGPAVAPGSGSGGVYVVFGQIKTADESWRRSKGGFSGVDGDFNYGSPRFVAHQNTANGDVADAQMAADGSWEMTLALPGKNITSFFDDTNIMDCVAAQCGVISFGAHGIVNAKNEAYTPVYFDGQDSKNWPDRGTVIVDPGTKPEPKPTPDPKPTVDPVITPPVVTPPPAKSAPYGSSTGRGANGATLTVTPAWALADKQQVVTVKGAGYDTSQTAGGAYVLFGWIDPATGAKWGPANGGRTGFDYVYHQEEDFQGLVSYPVNTNAGSASSARQGTMDAQGNWEGKFTIPASQFTAFGKTIDCYVVQCGVFTIGAHGVRNAGVEVFTPVYFTGEAENKIVPDARPIGSQPQGSAPVANTGGLPQTGTPEFQRLVLITGFLLLSAGAFSVSLVRRRRTTS